MPRRTPSLLVLLIALTWTPLGAQEFTLIRGDIPLLVVSPHGGTREAAGLPIRNKEDSQDPHFTRSRDMLTAELAEQLRADFPEGRRPSVLVAHLHRRYFDLNRSPHRAAETTEARDAHRRFHQALTGELERLLEQHSWALLLDIHGNSSEPFDLVIGTRQGGTVSNWGERALWGPGGLVEVMREAGFTVSPNSSEERIRFNGGYIVGHYGSDPSVDAWQLEHGKELRFSRERNELYTKTLARFLLRAVETKR